MATSIYISNEELQVVYGQKSGSRIKIEQAIAIPIPEGTIVNGIITDEQSFTSVLTSLKENYPSIPLKSVQLTIGSSMVFSERASLPHINHKQALNVVKGEMSRFDDGEMVYDYALLENRHGKEPVPSLFCSAKREFLESYMEIFKSVNISISAISIMLMSQIKLIRFIEALKDKTFVLVVLDGNNADACIYSNGQFQFANRSRLISPKGSTEMFNEIDRIISSLIQFSYSQKTGGEISDIFICGMGNSQNQLCDYLKQSYSYNVSPLSLEDVVENKIDIYPESFIYAIGSILSQKETGVNAKDLNLMERLTAKKDDNSSGTPAILKYAPLLLTAVVFGGVMAFMLITYNAKNNNLNDIWAYINDTKIIEEYARARKISDENNALGVAMSELNGNLEAIKSYPKLNKEVIDKVKATSNSTFTINSYSYSETTGVLKIGARASSENYMPEAVQKLRNTGVFTNIAYTGYTSSTDNSYACTIECMLAV